MLFVGFVLDAVLLPNQLAVEKDHRLLAFHIVSQDGPHLQLARPLKLSFHLLQLGLKPQECEIVSMNDRRHASLRIVEDHW